MRSTQQTGRGSVGESRQGRTVAGRWRVLIGLAVLVAGVFVLSGAVAAEVIDAGAERGGSDGVGANQAIPTGDIKIGNEPVFLEDARETGITLVGTLSGTEVGVLEIVNEGTGAAASLEVEAGQWSREVPAAVLEELQEGQIIRASLVQPESEELLGRARTRIAVRGEPPYGSVSIDTALFAGQGGFDVRFNSPESEARLRVQNAGTGEQVSAVVEADGTVSVDAEDLGGIRVGEYVIAELLGPGGEPLLSDEVVRVTVDEAPNVALQDPVFDTDTRVEVAVSDLATIEGSGWLRVENQQTEQSEVVELSEDQEVEVTAEQLGGLEPGDTVFAELSASESGDVVLERDTTTVTEQAATGSVDLEDQIRVDEGLFNVTITALDNAGGSGFLRVENLDNTESFVFAEVVAGDVISVAATEIGGFQAGDTLEARLAADSDFVDILDTDTEGILEASDPPEFVVDILDDGAPVLAGNELAVTVEITNTGGPGEQQVELDVEGLGGDSTSVSLDSGQSTTEILAVGTGPDDAGEYTATVSSENTEDSAGVVVTEAGEFVVSITGTNSPVTEGAALQVEAEITNTGGDDTQTLTLDAGALGTVETGVSLTGGETTQQLLTVETGPGDTGEYTATVASENTEDSTPVVVQDGEFVVSITGTNSPVDTGQQLEVTVEITNTGTEDTQTVSADTELGGEEVSVSLGGGETTTETFTVQTAAGDSGEYTVTVASEDTEDSAPVLVRGGGSDPAAFNVTITETNAPVEEGETLQLEVTVRNTGGTEATRTVTTEVGGLGSVETTVTLAPNESTTESFTVETAAGDTGEYEATAATGTDQDDTSLAVTPAAGQPGNATFEVTVESVSTPPGGDGEFEANVTVQNVGDAEGTETVTLSSSGTERGSETVTLAGGAAETLTFTWEQALAVDNETTLEVTAAAGGDTDMTEAILSPVEDGGGSGGISPTTGFGLLLLVALLLGLYYYLRRRQLRDQSDTGSDNDDGDGDTTGSGDGGGDDDSGSGGVTRVRSGSGDGDDRSGDVAEVRSGGGSDGSDGDDRSGGVAEVRSGRGSDGGDSD